MNTRFYDTDLTDAAWALLRRFCRRRDRAADRAPPTFVPSSTPSFTSCGQAASGDCCHANIHLAARSTITFKPGKTPVCGSIYIGCSTSRPVVMPARSLSFGGDHGWPIGQDDRAWWRSWFRRAQAGKGTQTRTFFKRSTLAFLCRGSALDRD